MKKTTLAVVLVLLLYPGKGSSLSHRVANTDSQQPPQRSSPIAATVSSPAPLPCGCADGQSIKPFESVEYWNDFYRNETEPWDWYSTEDWLPEIVSSILPWPRPSQPPDVQGYSVLDLGCGISSLLLDLARAGPPGKWRRLVGVDFCPSAVALLRAQSAELPPDGPRPEYLIDDAAGGLRGVPAGAFDAVVDKGCVDCHVASPGGRARLPALLRAARRALAPGGALLLLAVADADLPHLLATARVRPPPAAVPAAPARAEGRGPPASEPGPGGAAPSPAADVASGGDSDAQAGGGGGGDEPPWSDAEEGRSEGADAAADDSDGAARGKAPAPAGRSSGDRPGRAPLFHVHGAVAWQQKHLLVARAAPPPAPPRLLCGACGRRGPYPPPAPERCGCGAPLGRFALS